MIPYIIIVSIVILFYIQTIEFSIIVDDIRQYGLTMKKHYTWRFDREYKRFKWLRNLITNIREKLYGGGTFGPNTIYDHAFTTALHLLTCVLMYPALGSTQISFWATCLYAVHPINDQTAIWLNGRRYQIVIILVLLALLCAPYGFIFYMLSPIFQMTAFFFPVLYLNHSPLFVLVPILIAALMYRQIREKIEARMSGIMNQDQRRWDLNRFKVIIKTYGWYFFKMLHPGKTMFIYPTLLQWGVTNRGNEDAYRVNRDFWKGIAALALTGWLCTFPEIRLYAVFLFLATLQWSAIICAFQQLADRYISLANVFMMFMVSYLLWTYLPPVFAVGILMGLFGYYANQLTVTMEMFKTIDKFFDYHMLWKPEMARNRVIYADSYLAVKDITRAWLVVERGLFYDPDDFELLFRAAQCSGMVGMFDKAQHFIDRAEKNMYIGQENLQKERIRNLQNSIVDAKNRVKAQIKEEQKQLRLKK